MNTSENIDQIATALAKAQGEIINPAKEAENPHFRSRYADLAAGLNAVRPILSQHGLAVVQMTRMEGELMMLDTRLVHTSGQWVESSYPVCRFPAKQQEVGSALTYSRRYALFALVGIAGEDDDGNEASKRETPAPGRSATITASQAKDLRALIDEVGADEGRFVQFMKIDRLEDLPTARLEAAVASLNAKRKVNTPMEAAE